MKFGTIPAPWVSAPTLLSFLDLWEPDLDAVFHIVMVSDNPCFHVFLSLRSFYLLFRFIGIFSSRPAPVHPLLFYIPTVALSHILCSISSKNIGSSCCFVHFCSQCAFNCLSKVFYVYFLQVRAVLVFSIPPLSRFYVYWLLMWDSGPNLNLVFQ